MIRALWSHIARRLSGERRSRPRPSYVDQELRDQVKARVQHIHEEVERVEKAIAGGKR